MCEKYVKDEGLLIVNCSGLDTDNVYTQRGTLISDKELNIALWVIYTILCQTIDMFGTTSNIINIICFVKQGFTDPVNVSLFGLAISDLGCLVSLMWTNLCLTPAFTSADLPFHPEEFQYLTGCWPHVTFTRVSTWITALITLERCLCITVPLKIKDIVTPKRVAIITVCVFTVLISSIAPVYVVSWLGMKFYPARNRTLLGLLSSKNRESVERVSFAINNVFISFTAIVVIIVCTIILVMKLQKQTKWRMITTKTVQVDTVSTRNQKAAKMVVMISTLFIGCFVPIAIIFIAMSMEPNISLEGKYRNLALCLGGLGFVLESINSSMNIFIYYHMSSRYRATFRHLFCNNQNT